MHNKHIKSLSYDSTKPATENPGFSCRKFRYQNAQNRNLDRQIQLHGKDVEARSLNTSQDSGVISRTQTRIRPKENIFTNPSAIYLTRKQLSFERSASHLKPVPSKISKKKHKISHSQDSPSALPSLVPKQKIELVPIQSFQKISPKLTKKKSELSRKAYLDALKMFAHYTEDSISSKKKLDLQKEKSIMSEYANEASWLACVSESYSEYKPKVMQGLIEISYYTKNLLDEERKTIVNLIKAGDFDPNINTVKIKNLLKRKKKNQEINKFN